MLTRSRVALAAALSLLALTPALGAPNYQVKDANGNTLTIRAVECGGTGSGIYCPEFVPSDVNGTPLALALEGTDPGSPPTPNAGTGSRGWLATIAGKIEAVRALLAGTLTFNLPSGASTATGQTTGNASLASIDAKVPALENGRIPTSGSQPTSFGTAPFFTCTTTPQQVVAARPGRRDVLLVQEGTTLVRLGPSTVTASSGVPLPGTAYSNLTLNGGAAVYCVTASGTQTISYLETY